MALSRRDQEFYEEKLSLKAAGFLFLYTALVGSIGTPALLFLLDYQSGNTSKWSFDTVIKLAEMGLMLGCVVGVIMYLAFKLLLQVGWLPSRRP